MSVGRLLAWRKTLLVLGVWIGLCVVATGQSLLWEIEMGREVTVGEAFVRQLPGYLMWAAFTPFVFALAVRYSLLQRERRKPILAHLGASLLVAVLHRPVLVGLTWMHHYEQFEAFDEDWWFVLGSVSLGTLYIDALVYWLLVAGATVSNALREERAREVRTAELETQLAESRLQALQAQLHPHFFFNSLHAVGALVRTGRHDEAVAMVTGIGELMRLALREEGAPEVRLEEELEFVRRYLVIEAIRFEDRLSTSIELADEARDARVPHLLLQPVVENAVVHGIARASESGEIVVRAARIGDRLRIEVLDDGPGPESEARGSGIGLANVRERLEHRYGEASSVTLRARPEGGAIATIELPFLVEVGEWEEESWSA